MMGMMPELFNNTMVVNGIALDCWDADLVTVGGEKTFCATGPGGGVDPSCGAGGKRKPVVGGFRIVGSSNGPEWDEIANKALENAETFQKDVKYGKLQMEFYRMGIERAGPGLEEIRQKILAVGQKRARVDARVAKLTTKIINLGDVPLEKITPEYTGNFMKVYNLLQSVKAKAEVLKQKETKSALDVIRKANKDNQWDSGDYHTKKLVSGDRSELDPAVHASVVDAERQLTGLLHTKHASTISQTLSKNNYPHMKRSAYYENESAIRLTADADASTVIHEWGHAIETNPVTALYCLGFLRKRIGDESPRHMGPGYEADEVGWDDQFGKAFPLESQARYVGKNYNGSASEIVSMGMEKLMKDPVGFANADPEHFNFVLGIMTGRL